MDDALNTQGRPQAAAGAPKASRKKLQPVAPQTISDQVASQLRYLITSGEFKPGEKIPAERELASMLAVGRPAVREALRELKTHGLLVSGRGAQGTIVARLPTPRFSEPLSALVGRGAERIVELMEIRSAVEIEAAGLAARRATLQDQHALSELLTGPGDVLSPEDDIAFHAAIAESTHNPLFERVIREPVDLLHDHMAAILSVFYAEPGGASALQQQHDAIRQAIRIGNEEKARQAMRQHLDYVARGLAQLVGAGRVIRLVFVDLDGTLLSGPRHLSERAKRTLGNVREAGVEVVLVSSRAARAMRPFHEQLGLMSPLIACNGALLWDPLAGAGLAHLPLDHALAKEVVDQGRALGANVSVETDDDWFVDRVSRIMRENILSHGLVEPESVGTVDEVLNSGEIVDKISLDFRELDDRLMSTGRATVTRLFAQRVNVSETAAGMIEIVSREASKSAMAQRLARHMQVPAEQTMAIGDQDNDAALLRWAGIGVAMGNATPLAKEAADVITSSNLRDGVAEALERWVLGQKSLGPVPWVPKPAPATE